jgi:hypothetical protein
MMMRRYKLKVRRVGDCDFFLDRIAVASPQWNKGLTLWTGRAMAQVVSRWPLTAEARVNPCGICGGQSGTGTELELNKFRLLLFINCAAD